MRREQSKKGAVGAEKMTDKPEPPAERRARKPVSQASANSVTASSSKPGSASSSPQRKRHIVLTYKALDGNILRRELHQNYPNERWFDSYDSLDKKLKNSKGKSKNTEHILLSNLPILVGVKNGIEHVVGLQTAVRNTISYLLDIEAEWNPVTEINPRPEGVSSALWNGRLWLGGIKDSINEMGVLKKHAISAVVSIHPEDWLAKDKWEKLYEKWKGQPLKPGWTGGKRGQYLIELEDNSSSDLLAYFQKAFNFMDYYLSRGKNVLVHCKMGQSRSASLVLGYMMTKYYKQNGSKNSERPEDVLKRFTGDISMPTNEPNKIAPRTATSKRRGVNTEKFKTQLLRHFELLSKEPESQPFTSESTQQPKPVDKKAGGGIIKNAILVLCFIHDLKPTEEIMGYWSSRMKTNTHYWIQASKDKAEKKGIKVEDHLAAFNGFFESHTT
ncbi:hypothetical protein INS49_005861 [Diaporthe citri]|uniref:uncharacterized protein n=1 Tax=Diaporthe citri TaxID=83186 RepID=UPI001C81A364|nr:uncharacterized protein INS49_005861 [Diaporthe citri]KAG6364262.1 hypothetical protein INS49_005861 [Diaporthe citri]